MRYTDDFQPSPTRGSVRFINKERTSVEGLTASALAALRLSKRQKPVRVFDPNNSEHRYGVVFDQRAISTTGLCCSKEGLMYL